MVVTVIIMMIMLLLTLFAVSVDGDGDGDEHNEHDDGRGAHGGDDDECQAEQKMDRGLQQGPFYDGSRCCRPYSRYDQNSFGFLPDAS